MKRNRYGKGSATKRREVIKVPARRTGSKSRTGMLLADSLTVTAAQRRHLIEDVAFFRADRCREIEPGKYRKEDWREAEAEIARVLKVHGVR